LLYTFFSAKTNEVLDYFRFILRKNCRRFFSFILEIAPDR